MTAGFNARDSVPIPDAEFAFTWSEFRQIAELVHSEAGIVLPEGKANLVYSRLAKRLRLIGLRSFRDYCSLVQSSDGIDERQAMISAMTTNVTRFFREPHHFEFLAETVLPPLVASARRGGRVRVWSAGCSSGEEPYSIALTLLDLMPDAPNHDVRILATDLDPEMVSRGRAATYTASQVAGVPVAIRNKWIETSGSSCRISDAARSLIRFNELNLLAKWPMKGKFDLIFCRNVMIYFDEDTQNSIWVRFADLLPDGGHLCIGHSERIALDRQPFDLVAQTAYARRRRT